MVHSNSQQEQSSEKEQGASPELQKSEEPQEQKPAQNQESSKEKLVKSSGGKASTATLKGRILIDINKPLPQFDNGDSRAYAASDSQSKGRYCVAIVADQGQLPRWQVANVYENLAETSLLRFFDSGVVYWPPAGKEQYVFVYDASIGESIMSDEGKSRFFWRQTEIVDYLIAPMVRVLKTMSDRSFYHGSIRPDNIFFSGREKNKPVVLGDCLSVYPHSSQSALFLSTERAAAEPFGRGVGSLADDIYAFGVTLALLLRKGDELAGLSDNEILRKKIEVGSYNTIIGAERLPSTYVELLRGMLFDDESQRWTMDDLFSWLDGTRIIPPALPRRKKANRPFVFREKKYLFSDVLVLDLAMNVTDAIKVIDGGDLGQWIEKAFNDKELNEKYERAIERVKMMPSGGDGAYHMVAQVCLALNPDLPIFFKNRVFTYDGIGGMMARTCYEGRDVTVFSEALRTNLLDVAVGSKSISQNEILALIKSFDVCRSILHQKKRGSSVEKTVYHLCKIAPCFSQKFKNYYVHDAVSCLRAFEQECSKGGQVAILMDEQSMAFFSVHENRLIESLLYDLNQPDKGSQIFSNLRFLAMLQKKTKIHSLPSLSNLFSDSLGSVYTVFNNLKLRQQIIDSVKKEAQKGSLIGMAALLDNNVARQRDAKGFHLAKREYELLQYEYDQYNYKLSNKRTYGVVNGQEAASLVSWVIAMVITLMSVFAYLSGYRVF